jgi:hypothetical protein
MTEHRPELRVDPGRRPTPIGGDGWPPSLLAPHACLARITRLLRRHRIDYELTLRAAYDFGRRQDPDGTYHRFVFPRNAAAQIQALVDSIEWSNDSLGRPADPSA